MDTRKSSEDRWIPIFGGTFNNPLLWTLTPCLIGLPAGLLFPYFLALPELEWIRMFLVSMSVSLIGAAFLLWAKWPRYRAKKFWHFGVDGLPALNHLLYRLSWIVLIPSIGMMALLLLIHRRF